MQALPFLLHQLFQHSISTSHTWSTHLCFQALPICLQLLHLTLSGISFRPEASFLLLKQNFHPLNFLLHKPSASNDARSSNGGASIDQSSIEQY